MKLYYMRDHVHQCFESVRLLNFTPANTFSLHPLQGKAASPTLCSLARTNALSLLCVSYVLMLNLLFTLSSAPDCLSHSIPRAVPPHLQM